LEKQPGNTLVGYLIAIDPDGPTTSSFSSIPGKAGCSSSGFNWFIVTNGNEIRSLAPLDASLVGSYTLCIRATDSLGALYEKQLTISVVDITSPRVISVTRADVNPTNASSVHFVVTFSEPVTGVDAADFDLTVTNISGASVANVSGSNSVYSVSVNTGIGNGTLRLDVGDNDSILDLVGNPLASAFSTGAEYSIVRSATKPGVPVLSSPASGALVSTLQPILDWKDSVPAAHHYQLQVATNSTFIGLAIDDAIVMTSLFTPASDLLPGKLYYWRVRALNVINDASNWSAVQTFKTPLAQPTVVAPANAQSLLTDRPAFDWDAVPGASQYVLQVSTVNTFKTLVLTTTVNSVDSYTPVKDLPQNQLLYWRAQAKNSVVTGPWSSASSFTTGNPPSIPVMVAPVNNSLVKVYTPLLNWKDSTLPSGTTLKQYELEVDEDSDFSSPEITATSTISEHPIGTNLASNTRFYWRVRAVNNNDHYSAWSTIWSFRTAIDAPGTLATADTGNPLRPRFEWAEASGPITNYTIQISTSANFSTFLVNGTTMNSAYNLLKDLPAGTTIYWRVKVNGANGPSAWTTAQFTTP
jgi:hypothetical protein